MCWAWISCEEGECMGIARERRNVFPETCFSWNTRCVNFYRRGGKTQRARAENCIAIFFPRAILKLLERVRLPSRNFAFLLRNMFAFALVRCCARLVALSGIKFSRIPFTLQNGDRPRALWNGLFFYREHPPTESIESAGLPAVADPAARDSRRAALREIAPGGRRVAGSSRGEQSRPFTRGPSLYVCRKRQTSRARHFPHSL